MGSARRGPAAAAAIATASARADASASGGVMRRRCLVLEAAAFMVRGRLRRREAAGEMLARGEKEDGRCPALGSGSVSRGLPLGEGPKSSAPGAGAPRPKGGRGRLTLYPMTDAGRVGCCRLPPMVDPSRGEAHYKDEVLDRLAKSANVAQFVSFGPDLRQRFAWVHGFAPNQVFDSLEAAATVMLAASPERSVNVRSYQPNSAKSRDFLYGLREPAKVVESVRRLAGSDLYTVINETIDVHDGGVSGGGVGGVLELAPGDTPRCVEKPGTAALPREMGLRLLETVYGVRLELPADPELRVEWSLHPLRRGYRHQHTVLWEVERFATAPADAQLHWPNRFSRLLGDKAFGLLVADAVGLPVPRTMVVPRGLAPFSFGTSTGLAETWLRTCPVEQQPGKFTTRHGWIDPFQLLQQEDPTGKEIASVLAQQGVDAHWSGGLIAPPAGGRPKRGRPRSRGRCGSSTAGRRRRSGRCASNGWPTPTLPGWSSCTEERARRPAACSILAWPRP